MGMTYCNIRLVAAIINAFRRLSLCRQSFKTVYYLLRVHDFWLIDFYSHYWHHLKDQCCSK